MDILNKLLDTFYISGGLGILNFFIIRELDIMKFRKNENYLFLLLFSLINYVIYLTFYSLLDFVLNAPQSIILSIIFTLALTLLMSFTFYPWAFSRIIKEINKKRTTGFGKTATHDLPPMKIVFDRSEVQEVYVFKLSDKSFISSGIMKDWTTLNDYSGSFSLKVHPKDGLHPEYFNENNVAETMNKYDEAGIETTIFIDSKNDLIFYIAYLK